MSTTRDLGGVSLSVIEANQIEVRLAIRMDLSDATVLRMTDRVGGFTASIDGGSATWTETPFDMGPIPQSRTDVMTVSWIRFANLDYTWTNRAYTPGLRGATVKVWAVWWDAAGTSIQGSYQLFGGKVDDQQIGQTATLTLVPFVPTWTKVLPWARAGVTCVNRYKGVRCQYAGSEPTGETTCDKTRRACIARSNEVHFNGADLLPPPGTTVVWGGLHLTVGGNPGPGGGSVDPGSLPGTQRILLPGRSKPPTHLLGPR